MDFTEAEWLRYTRHIQLPKFGSEGQTKLKKSHVLIIGMGGLGSPVGLYLAAAGVGQLTLIDGDTVELTNLQRQILFTTNDIGKTKTGSAKQRLLALNPEITIHTYEQHFCPELAKNINADFDLVIDCTDNFPTRYLINDYCRIKQLPWIYAGIHQFSGQCALFMHDQACFRCLFPQAPDQIEDCNSGGVIGVLPGLLGLFQANEAIRYLAGLSTPLANHLLLFDASSLSTQKMKLTKNQKCACHNINPAHNNNPDVANILTAHQHDYEFACASENNSTIEITPTQFNQTRAKDDVVVLDIREESERQAFHIGGKHIPLSRLSDSSAEFNADATYLCYCQSGMRSIKAADILTGQGYKAFSVTGGLSAWLKDSLKP
jgi:adenylyltransferase/sulfurtransferase